MNRHFFVILACLFSIITFVSCEKENIVPSDIEFAADKKYFPLETGHTLIYKVTEINIDKPSDYYDTSIYYIRERVDIPFVDNEGDTAFRIERFKSPTQNYYWQMNDVWEAKLTTYTAEKVEENQRIIKIKFPLEINKTWYGNLKNETYSPNNVDTCRIASLTETYTKHNINMDSCLLITCHNVENLISKLYDCEMYAKNIGLVYKEITDINSQEVIYGVPIENRIHRGKIFIQELVEIEQ